MKNIFVVLCLFFASHQAFALKGVVVLLPGTMNSAVPNELLKGPDAADFQYNPYFSKTVRETIQSQDYDVFVVKWLEPTGHLEENGQRSLDQLSKWYLKNYPAKNVPITLLGHSAGGFYALYAATQNKDLPIEKIIMVATPLEGTKLASFFFGGSTLAQIIWDHILSLVPIIDLHGLLQLTPNGVKDFLQKIKLGPAIRVFAVGGSQNPPPNSDSKHDMEYLPPTLTITNKILGRESDGVVEVTSAYAETTTLNFAVKKLRTEHVDLDHVEQFRDYRILKFFGIKNAETIDARQKAFYSRLLQAAN